jgi:hypothetical protein
MIIRKTASLLLRFTGLLLALVYLTGMNFRNELPVDAGDGIAHYSIARQSWVESFYFLDHWGKPLFTLLSSPFAQAGFQSFVVFNLLIFTATCLVVFAIFRKLNVATAYYFFFPLLLICVPDYSYCILGGMTEPLFGLLLTAAVYAAFCQRWIVFAIVVSFTPFARSEGMFVVVLALGLLLTVGMSEYRSASDYTIPRKKILRIYSTIPFLATGFIIYAIAGWWLIDMPMWYFENDPYPEGSIYGNGPWWWYLSTWKNHFGLITLALLPFGVFGCIVLWKKQLVRNFIWIFLFTAAVYGGIVFIHSCLWMLGIKGAGGLTRLAIQGLPPVLMLIIVGCHFVTKQLNSIPHIVAGLGVSMLIIKEIPELPYPLKANPFEKLLIQSADYAHAHFPGKRIYYFHPLIPWRLNVGTKDTESNMEQRYFHRMPKMVVEMQEGGIVIRDPQFGPVEQGLPLDFVDSFKTQLVPVKVFKTKEPHSVYTGEKVEVVLYQYKP